MFSVSCEVLVARKIILCWTKLCTLDQGELRLQHRASRKHCYISLVQNLDITADWLLMIT